MKKLIIGIIAVALSFTVSTAKAEDQKVIAILDSAIDSSKIPNVIYEVCITRKSCAGGTSFAEGKGSANIQPIGWLNADMNHGHNITMAAVNANPNIKIVFIRIADLNIYPTFTAIHSDGSSLTRAMDWLAKNASKYSIDAVSISQARSNFKKGTCPLDQSFESSVQMLNQSNILTFVATGNNGFWDFLSFPACAKGVHPVVASRPTGEIAKYSNRNAQAKLVARGDTVVNTYANTQEPIFGTSVATVVAASSLMNKWAGGTLIDLISNLPTYETYKVVS